MPSDGLVLQPIREHREAVTSGVHIGVVDLVRVTCQDYLRTLATPRHHRFDLMRGEVLGLVHNHKLLRQTPPANVSERLYLNLTRIEQILKTAIVPAPVAACNQEILQVVVERLHPGS